MEERSESRHAANSRQSVGTFVVMPGMSGIELAEQVLDRYPTAGLVLPTEASWRPWLPPQSAAMRVCARDD